MWPRDEYLFRQICPHTCTRLEPNIPYSYPYKDVLILCQALESFNVPFVANEMESTAVHFLTLTIRHPSGRALNPGVEWDHARSGMGMEEKTKLPLCVESKRLPPMRMPHLGTFV